jgi:hypothetical protein
MPSPMRPLRPGAARGPARPHAPCGPMHRSFPLGPLGAGGTTTTKTPGLWAVGTRHPGPAVWFWLVLGVGWSLVLQRRGSQNSTSGPGDAIWGAHRPNYIHGQFGGGGFAPQVPPAPRCTPVVISTKLTSRLSLAPCCAGQPSFGHIQAAPRRALWLDWATIQFRFYQPNSFNTALQLVLRPHFLVHFV